jgi:hypothetical protein
MHAPSSRPALLGRAVLWSGLAIAAILTITDIAVPTGERPVVAAARAGRAGRAATRTPDFNGDGFADLAISAPRERLASVAAGAVHVVYGSAAGLKARGSQYWHQNRRLIREQAEDRDHFGQSLGPGDFDGDGFTDLAIAAPQESAGARAAGAVHVLRGSPTGLIARRNQLWSQGSPGIGDAPEAGDQFGWTLTAADFNRDGFDDLAVGAPFEDLRARDAGAVNVIYGSPNGLRGRRAQLWTQNTPGILNVAETGDLFGRSLAAGDFDGDRFADLAIGAPYEDGRNVRDGGVHVLFGGRRGLTARRNQWWNQDSPGILGRGDLREQYGQSLAAADFDRDGYDDLAAGIWFQDFCRICNEGALSVIYGSRRGLTAAGDQLWTQDSPGIRDMREPFDRFSNSLSPGDFDGDRFADLAVAAPREDYNTSRVFQNKGGVNVLFGSRRGLTTLGNQHWSQDSPGIADHADWDDQFGLSLGSADYNGDGFDELAIGVRFEDLPRNNEGAVNVVYGTPRGLRAARNQLWSQDSPGIADQAEPGDFFGWALSGRWPASGTPGFNRSS